MHKISNILVSICILGSYSVSAQRPVVLVPGSTEKIEQLIGDYDKERGVPTQNLTYERYLLPATDLGVPFRHKDRTYVCFGDVWIDNGDPVAYTTDTDPEDGIQLDFITNADNSYRKVTIPGVSMGGFEVPMEGVSWNGNMYLYCTTSVMTRSILAKSTDDGLNFTKIYDVSDSKFINLNLVKSVSDANYPVPEGTEIQIMFGSGTYRKSSVYLAFQPGALIDQRSIYYFYGVDDKGKPKWSPYEAAALPLFNQPCVGELSISYNTYIRQWILTYNCDNPRGINCRVADNPWGPWSDPFVIFDPANGYCHFMHTNWEFNNCDNVYDPGRAYEWGGEYGPYQFDQLATGVNGETTIYYTMSTWNPYTVVLMKSTLKDLSVSNRPSGDISVRGLTIYPNPSDGIFRVSGASENEFYRIYTLTGELYQTGVIGSDEQLVLKAGSGVFILKMDKDPSGYKLIVF